MKQTAHYCPGFKKSQRQQPAVAGERSTGFKTDAKTATRGGGGSKNHKDSNPPLRGVTGSVAAFLPAVAGVLPLLRGVTGSVTAFLPAWTGFQGPIKNGNIYICIMAYIFLVVSQPPDNQSCGTG